MQREILMVLAAGLTQAGCNQTECGEGTIERNGRCEPADVVTSSATCGEFTKLVGDVCVPELPPTQCDPMTTTPSTDLQTGITTCIGTGTAGCSGPFACPAPSGANRLTVCGQLYDFETNMKFAAMGATGATCNPASPATSGPCALQILAFDALEFAQNPAAATPRNVESVVIDDCGRYRLVNIDTNGTSPLIGLGIDDAGQPFGPTGVTVTVGVATPKASPVVTDFEAFVVKATTAGMWQASGGPPLSGGIFAAIYRAHKADAADRDAPQADVTFTKMNMTVPSSDYYFAAAQTTRQTIDPATIMTGANGTALVTGRSVGEGPVFDGLGGLGTGCRWEQHAAASLPGVVFVQIYRKADLPSMTCND